MKHFSNTNSSSMRESRLIYRHGGAELPRQPDAPREGSQPRAPEDLRTSNDVIKAARDRVQAVSDTLSGYGTLGEEAHRENTNPGVKENNLRTFADDNMQILFSREVYGGEKSDQVYMVQPEQDVPPVAMPIPPRMRMRYNSSIGRYYETYDAQTGQMQIRAIETPEQIGHTRERLQHERQMKIEESRRKAYSPESMRRAREHERLGSAVYREMYGARNRIQQQFPGLLDSDAMLSQSERNFRSHIADARAEGAPVWKSPQSAYIDRTERGMRAYGQFKEAKLQENVDRETEIAFNNTMAEMAPRLEKAAQEREEERRQRFSKIFEERFQHAQQQNEQKEQRQYYDESAPRSPTSIPETVATPSLDQMDLSPPRARINTAQQEAVRAFVKQFEGETFAHISHPREIPAAVAKAYPEMSTQDRQLLTELMVSAVRNNKLKPNEVSLLSISNLYYNNRESIKKQMRNDPNYDFTVDHFFNRMYNAAVSHMKKQQKPSPLPEASPADASIEKQPSQAIIPNTQNSLSQKQENGLLSKLKNFVSGLFKTENMAKRDEGSDYRNDKPHPPTPVEERSTVEEAPDVNKLRMSGTLKLLAEEYRELVQAMKGLRLGKVDVRKIEDGILPAMKKELLEAISGKNVDGMSYGEKKRFERMIGDIDTADQVLNLGMRRVLELEDARFYRLMDFIEAKAGELESQGKQMSNDLQK